MSGCLRRRRSHLICKLDRCPGQSSNFRKRKLNVLMFDSNLRGEAPSFFVICLYVC